MPRPGKEPARFSRAGADDGGDSGGEGLTRRFSLKEQRNKKKRVAGGAACPLATCVAAGKCSCPDKKAGVRDSGNGTPSGESVASQDRSHTSLFEVDSYSALHESQVRWFCARGRKGRSGVTGAAAGADVVCACHSQFEILQGWNQLPQGGAQLPN
jgi:hypothetical protein